MTNLQKVLLAAGGIATIAATAYVVKKTTERQYATVKEDDFVDEDIPQDKTVFESIKKAANKKATDILAYVILHKEQIEAAGTIIGIAGATLGVINAFRDYRRSDEQLDLLRKNMESWEEFKDLWNVHQENSYTLYSRVDEVLEAVHGKGKK